MCIAAQGFGKPNYTFTAGNSSADVRVSHVCPVSCPFLSVPSTSLSPLYYTGTHAHSPKTRKDQELVVTSKGLISVLMSSRIHKKAKIIS